LVLRKRRVSQNKVRVNPNRLCRRNLAFACGADARRCDRRQRSRTIPLRMYYSAVAFLPVCPRHVHRSRDDAGARPLVSRWSLLFPRLAFFCLRSYASPDQRQFNLPRPCVSLTAVAVGCRCCGRDVRAACMVRVRHERSQRAAAAADACDRRKLSVHRQKETGRCGTTLLPSALLPSLYAAHSIALFEIFSQIFVQRLVRFGLRGKPAAVALCSQFSCRRGTM